MRALNLSGGGAHGVIQLGMYTAYVEKYQDYTGLFGTSVGSLNGMLIQQGELPRLIELWQNIQNSDVYNINPLKMFGKAASLASTKPLERLINKYINIDLLSKNPRKFNVTATCITDAKSETRAMPCKDAAKWVLASASAPLAFPVQEIDGKQYSDGGQAADYNINQALLIGYDEIIALIPNGPAGMKINNLIDMLEFQLAIQGATQLSDNTAMVNLLNKSVHTVALTIYRPTEPLDLGILDFNNASKNYEKWYQLGYNLLNKPSVQFRRVLQAGKSRIMVYH